MAKFRDVKTLQKFASADASIRNHFNHNRHLLPRDIYKQNRSAALAEWRELLAYGPAPPALLNPPPNCLTVPSIPFR